MREMWVIAKREFLERVRTRWFVVMTILWPVLMIALMVVPALLGGGSTDGAKVVIVDRTGNFAQSLGAQLALTLKWNIDNAPPETDEKGLRARIKSHDINGYVVIPSDALDGGEIIYTGDNASNQTVAALFPQLAQNVVVQKRGERMGLNGADLISLTKRVNVSVRHTTGEEEGAAGMAVFLVGYMLAMLMYMVITIYGFGVMRSVVTEKTSHVVELLVAATKPRAMMSGKILGVGGAGLLQIAIWIVAGALLISQQDAILGRFGVAPGASKLLPSFTGGQVVVTVGYFLLGYLFYASMYAAVGAMVSSEQDTQQAQMPITFMLVIGIISVPAVIGEPHGQVAQILSMVPLWSPMTMPPRYFVGAVSGAEAALSLGILAISTVLVARIAATIYRVGILMYGKRPSLREIVRWLRYRG